MKVARKDLYRNEKVGAAYNELSGRCSFLTSKARREYMAWSKAILKVVEDIKEFKEKTEKDLADKPAEILEQMEDFLAGEIELPPFTLADNDFEGGLSGVALQGLEFLGVLKYEQS